ncbi:MAG: TlpA family protein disulfide reductase [Calditrichaeota bacterium]|nr:TlpA family protein disulfide reductase [Calditrichota bacterium]
MKYRLTFLFLLFFFYSPIYSNTDNITIKGVVNSQKAVTLLLIKKYDISQNIQTVLDTILLDKNGTFNKTYGYDPGIYQLDFKGLTKINTALEPGQTVDFSIKQDSNMKIITNVKGSKDAEFMVQYEQYRKTSFKKWIQPFREKMKIARKKGDFELIKKLTADEVRGLSIYTEEITSFTKNNVGHSIAFFYAAIRFNPDIELPYLKKMSEWFAENRPNLFLTKEFVAKVNRFKKIEIGQKAPYFSLLSLQGNETKLSSFEGSYVLLDFWASWCLPCRTENLNYAKLYKKYKQYGFEILSVALETKKQLWEQASKKDGVVWTNTSELNGWGSKIAKEYNVSAIPANFLLDKGGKIIAKNLRGFDLQMKLEEMFD